MTTTYTTYATFSRRIICECCRSAPSDRQYGEADESGHLWMHHVCEACYAGCGGSDDGGNPIHTPQP